MGKIAQEIDVEWDDSLEKKLPVIKMIPTVTVTRGNYQKSYKFEDVKNTYESINKTLNIELKINEKMFESTADLRYQEAIETLNRIKQYIYSEFKTLKNNVEETWIAQN